VAWDADIVDETDDKGHRQSQPLGMQPGFGRLYNLGFLFQQ
jgi:hypothetical protein